MTWSKWIKIPPDWFDEKAYLEANPGVAASPHFKDRPFEHFVSSGYSTGKTWKGDPRAKKIKPGPRPPEPPGPHPGPGPEKLTIWPAEFTGNEGATKVTKDFDNYKRFGAVVRGYYPGSSKRYMYNTKYVDSGRGHVWYIPDIPNELAAGPCRIEWFFRKTGNRSRKRPDIRHVRGGVVLDALSGPVQYSDGSSHDSFVFFFVLQAGDHIEIMPADNGSTAFGRMIFTRMED